MKMAKRETAKAMICKLILQKKTDEFILDKVVAAFPDNSTDERHISKYRRELLVAEEIDESLASLKSKGHQDWAKEHLAQAKKGPHKAYWVQWDKDQKVKAAEAKKATAAKRKKAA